jgi:ribosomal protein S18 acetylase RimI-like enzyme
LGWAVRDGIAPSSSLQHFGFFGAFREARLLGAALLAGGVLFALATHDPQAARALAGEASLRPGAFRVLVGPWPAVDGAWSVFESRGFRARLRRPQVMLAVGPSELRYFPAPELRLADFSDVEAVLAATLDMHEHETLEPPLPRDVPMFRRSVEYQIGEGRLSVWTQGPRRDLCFKAAVSAQCDLGAQIEGVYVPVALRRHGFALRGLSEQCQRLLLRMPRVSLYVNHDNHPALELYRRLGFVTTGRCETIFLERVQTPG